jgi:DNA polymerase-3 subunit delta
MPVATPSAVRKQIAAATPDRLYLLVGEDEIEKAELAREFDALVDEELRAFNVERIHAGDLTTGDRIAATVDQLIASARTLPLLSPHRVVIVLQAEGLLAPRRDSEAATRAYDRLEALIKQPEPQTTVVFVAGALDRRSRGAKLVAKQATVVECGVIEDRADAERWVARRVSAAGGAIDAAGARLLADRAGTDVARLRNDVERLLLYALGQPAITVEDVKQVVGRAALQDDWAMTNAIEAGNAGEALRQLALLLDSGAAAEKVLGQLGWLVRAKFPMLAPAALGTAVDALFRTDQDLKRSAGDARILLERLVVELCGGRARRGQGARPLHT